MDKILDEIISSKEQIQPVTYVPAGTRIIIYPMQDLWLRTTKDIKEGRGSDIRGDNDEPPLISEEDDKPKNVQGNNKQQNNNNNQEVPLVANTNTQQNQQNTNAAGALPPPTADGTGMKMPDEEKKEDEIDIDF
jgi:hypothetical protein